jgi:hypothetical protein
MRSSPDLHHLSKRDFTWFGLLERAYIKAESIDGVITYAIHAANGHLLARLADRSLSQELARQEFAMELLSVH